MNHFFFLEWLHTSLLCSIVDMTPDFSMGNLISLFFLACGWIHRAKNQRFQQISGPISSMIIIGNRDIIIYLDFFNSSAYLILYFPHLFLSSLNNLLIHIRSVWRKRRYWYSKSSFPTYVTIQFLPFSLLCLLISFFYKGRNCRKEGTMMGRGETAIMIWSAKNCV